MKGECLISKHKKSRWSAFQVFFEDASFGNACPKEGKNIHRLLPEIPGACSIVWFRSLKRANEEGKYTLTKKIFTGWGNRDFVVRNCLERIDSMSFFLWWQFVWRSSARAWHGLRQKFTKTFHLMILCPPGRMWCCHSGSTGWPHMWGRRQEHLWDTIRSRSRTSHVSSRKLGFI